VAALLRVERGLRSAQKFEHLPMVLGENGDDILSGVVRIGGTFCAAHVRRGSPVSRSANTREARAVDEPRSMRAWRVVEPGPVAGHPLRFESVPLPEIGPNDLLVRVLACGVCRTDLHVTEGDLPVHRV